MGHIEWAMWANEQAVLSGFALLLGGIIGVAGQFRNWEFAAFAIVASVLILLLEWPRSKRKQGTTVQRTFQLPLTKLLSKMRPVSDNYYVRYVLHLLLSVPCCFLLPTIMGAMSLLIAAFIYLLAAIKGEHWQPVEMNSDFSPDPTTRPNRAPPRNIQTSHLC